MVCWLTPPSTQTGLVCLRCIVSNSDGHSTAPWTRQSKCSSARKRSQEILAKSVEQWSNFRIFISRNQISIVSHMHTLPHVLKTIACHRIADGGIVYVVGLPPIHFAAKKRGVSTVVENGQENSKFILCGLE